MKTFILNFLKKKYPAVKFILDYQPKSIERKEILRRIMNYVSACRIEGDYLEFGVYKGSTFIEAYKMAKAKKLRSMKFFAFDSFEGLPEISKEENIPVSFEQFRKGQYSFSLENFRKNLERADVSMADVKIVPGWFDKVLNEDTKNKIGLGPIAVAWVDGDLYESAVSVLDFIRDHIVDGTILVFDNWFFFRGSPFRGEQLAFREWLRRNPDLSFSEFHKYFWHGNSFIIHKN